MATCTRKYTSIALYIPTCLETLTIKTGLTGDYIVRLQDRFGNIYKYTGITTGDIDLDLTDTDIIPDGFVSEFTGQIGVLIYISENLFEWTCSSIAYNSLVFKFQNTTPSETDYEIDLTDCGTVGEFDASFNFDFNV